MKKLQLRNFRKAEYLSLALILAFVALVPAVFVNAAQITSRSLSISSAVPSKTSVQYTFTFTVPSTVQVQGLKLQACNTAVGTCNGTAGTDLPNFGSRTFGTQSGWQGATNFAVDTTGANDCTPGNTVICANRTDTTAQTATSRTIRFDGITNGSTANQTFFIRMTTYTTNNYTVGSITDTGTVASAVTQSLTVNAAVAEVLNFCVGSTTVNDATTSVGADCTAVSGTSLNIGTLDTGSVNVSPVNTNGGDNKNGVAMIRTNAASGATVSYDAIQQSGTNQLGTLRISGATCNASAATLTDQCIRAIGTTQSAITAGTENWGMTIGGTNCGSTSSYTCVYGNGSTPENLVPQANYVGNGTTGSPNTYTYGTGNGFAWDDSGTSQTIASSASSTTKVIDDEALILRFAATPSITTPFGLYAAQADFIAVPTY